MVTKINEKMKDALAKVEGKGDPTVVAGTTESGKTTTMNALAKSEDVQALLEIREASGKGSTAEESIIATDYDEIPEDKLIMIANLCQKKMADCNDDNEFLANAIYSAAKDYAKNPDDKLYIAKMSKALANALDHPANESLAYKLKDMTEEDFNAMHHILSEFSIEEVMLIYNEMLAKNPKKGQKGVHIFIELLSARTSFAPSIQKFWEFVVELINRDVEELKSELRKTGAEIEVLNDDVCKFTTILGIEDADSKIVETLLKSEDGSKEYLLSDISLIFRGADYLFDVKNVDLLTVSECDGKKIHSLRFIDTQGLFHATGVKTKDETERIIDILSTYHSNKLLLVVSSFVTDTVKDGYEAIRLMLKESNRNIEIYVLYTHWDEYLKNFSQQNNKISKFSRGKASVNWNTKFAEATDKQSILSADFKSCLASNTSKNKPEIKGFYRASILLDPDSTMEDVLDENKITYPEALHGLVEQILDEQAKIGPKHRVLAGIEGCFSIDIEKLGKQNISSLYDNLVVECKGLKLYASTVRACIRKWCGSGTVHDANVAENDNGFKEIHTNFVREIRNYAMSFINKLNIEADKLVTDSSDIKKFADDLIQYLSLNQNLGREVAKLIGLAAYREGFEKKTCFRYQYQRFEDMIQYTQDNYFTAKNIDYTDAFAKCLTTAIADCITNFVDAKCIVVY